MPDTFSVDAKQLRRLAGVYEAQANRLASAISDFSTDARPPGDAYGVLGPAHDVHAKYLRSVDTAEQALRQAHGELMGRKALLLLGAAMYEAADKPFRP
jgi:hypothetical protein